jgi:hypothetical protein
MKIAVVWDIEAQFVRHRKYNISATESSRLLLCKNWGFHGGDYEERRVALIITDASAENIVSIIGMK